MDKDVSETCLDIQHTEYDDRLQIDMLTAKTVSGRASHSFQTRLSRALLRDARGCGPGRRRWKLISVIWSRRNWKVCWQDDVVIYSFLICNIALPSTNKSIRLAAGICSNGAENSDFVLVVVRGTVK